MRVLVFGIGIVAALLLATAVVAPVVAEAVVDRVLDTLPEYDAEVVDADVSLTGATALDGLTFRKRSLEPPFLSVDRVVFRARLGALLRGDRIADVEVEGLVVNYVVGPDPERSQTGIDPDWTRRWIERFPVAIDGLTVRGATAVYHDHAARPDVHVVVDEIEVDAANLANLERSGQELFGRIAVHGRIEDSGRLTARVAVDPYADAPRFTLDARVDDVALPELNDALRAYGRLDVSRGTFSATTHLDASGGRYEGVVRPQVDDLEVVGPHEKQGPLAAVWEAVVGTAADLADAFSRDRERVSAELRISGASGEAPALLEVLELLPRAWFGALARAARVGSEATAEAARGAVEAGRATERERGDR